MGIRAGGVAPTVLIDSSVPSSSVVAEIVTVCGLGNTNLHTMLRSSRVGSENSANSASLSWLEVVLLAIGASCVGVVSVDVVGSVAESAIIEKIIQ